ncbi:MAG: class I SAM-dependent methyltransferase [Solirubrobacterales bacterium]
MSNAIVGRYDRDARLYEQWWAPVLASSAAALLDRVAPWVEARVRASGACRILDVGTGTGALAIDAARRWPRVTVTGVDASRGMLAVARQQAASELGHGALRIRWQRAEADSMPIDDASVDLVVSSFVYQLVPDRAAALREAWRVLRPGGRLWLVTWIDRYAPFAPADEFDEAVYDVEIDEGEERDEDVRAGDFRSAAAARRELSAAGFVRLSTELATLEQRWTRESYLDYKVAYDESSLLSGLDDGTARRLEARARERLAALPDAAFLWRPQIVYARGDRPR